MNKIINVITILIAMLSFVPIKTLAADYINIEDRIKQNRNITKNIQINQENLYQDKYLIDMKETLYKGLTENKQKELEKFTNDVILNKNNKMTNYEKIIKIYNWIKKNYYFYETPYKIKELGINCDNPYYILTNEYYKTKKVRAREEGFSATLIALSRTQNIPARMVEGHFYNKEYNQNYLENNITKNRINHQWVEVYINKKWIAIDIVASTNKKYDERTKKYTEELGNIKKNYFNLTLEELSKTHVILKYRKGSTNIKYITDAHEKEKLKKFLNKKTNGKTNGEKINKDYNEKEPITWFEEETLSKGDGYGKLSIINWPSKKQISGNLDLSNFSKLESLKIENNNLTNLYLKNCGKLTNVEVNNNNLKKIIITNSSNLIKLETKNNKAVYIEYVYNNDKKAVIKATTGGSISVNYEKNKKDRYKHEMKAIAKKGYNFKGWYKNEKLVSKNKNITVYKENDFTYIAKFEEKPTYIIVSIKDQMLWYYKRQELILTSNVVTGNQGEYDTPKGTYTIKSKSKNLYLIGEDYKSWVDYWMLIDYGTEIGLHDANWRTNFGGNIYKTNGSHGCINLPHSVAKKIYETAKVGTKVIIN